ncbi:MAG: gliding motility-associated C-terminal domain-containing protein, partial [Chitinophagaceae bacterium]
GFFFTTTASVADVVVRMTNNAPGGCGNDLLLDDITFRPCGPLLTPGFTGSPGTQKTVCAGTAASFDLTVGVSAGYVTPRFQWQRSRDGGAWTDVPGATTQSLSVAVPASETPGNYRYRLTVAESINWGTSACTVASAPLTITVVGRPVINAANNGPLCAGTAASLSATGAVSYAWSGPGGFSAIGGSAATGILNNAGTHTYTVAATDIAGCTWTAGTSVLVLPQPSASVAADTVGACAGTPVTLQASGGGAYKWTPTAGISDIASPTPLATPADSTRYAVIVRNTEGCTDTAWVQVNVRPAPRADAGPDRVLFLGDALQLEGSVRATPGYSALWSPDYFLSDAAALQPVARPEKDTVYVLSVTSADGCGTHRDSMRVRVYRRVEVPNVFTPNGDGMNDRWEIPALEAYRNYTVEVFTRWGQVLERYHNSFSAWSGTRNGKPLPTGTYYYVIRIGDTGQQISGAVDLIR